MLQSHKFSKKKGAQSCEHKSEHVWSDNVCFPSVNVLVSSPTILFSEFLLFILLSVKKYFQKDLVENKPTKIPTPKIRSCLFRQKLEGTQCWSPSCGENWCARGSWVAATKDLRLYMLFGKRICYHHFLILLWVMFELFRRLYSFVILYLQYRFNKCDRKSSSTARAPLVVFWPVHQYLNMCFLTGMVMT